MLSTLQKNLPAICLTLTALLGLALGCLGAALTGEYLRPAVQPGKALASERPAPVKKPVLTDYQVILQRNIFDSTAPGIGTLSDAEALGQGAAPAPRADLTLYGTVVAGARSLAVIHTGQEIKSFRLGDELPGGGRLEEIARNLVQIRYPGGPLEALLLYKGEGPKGTASAPGTSGTSTDGTSIKAVGENRWVIPRGVAEQARGNLNELLRQARMEPNIVEGRTEGFVVRMIRPKSLLDTLGIQRGDILMQINGMPLDSPEKALQVFQQLREAKHLSIGLTRSGTPMNFEYEVE
jgi:general secretion pathway protein C